MSYPNHGRPRLDVEQLENRWVPSASDFVRGLYTDVLNRTGSDAEVNSWVQVLNSGTSSRDVARAFVQSDEHRIQEVNELYQNAFGRQADAGGRDHWVEAMRNGDDIRDIEQSLIQSSEFQNAHSSNSDFVSALYHTLLGRAPDAGGLQGWTNQLNNGLDRDDLVEEFQDSTEYLDNHVSDLYQTYLHRSAGTDERAYWIQQLRADDDLSFDDEGELFLASREYGSAHGF